MALIDELKKSASAKLFDDDNEPYCVELLPPANATEIDELQNALGGAVDAELTTALSYARGFSGGAPTDIFDLVGSQFSIDASFAFREAHPIASDGTGNFWIVDLSQGAITTAPVYYVCHDPPVVVFQSQNVTTFVKALLQPRANDVRRVYDDGVFDIWRAKQLGQDSVTAALAGDPLLTDFARQVGPGYMIFDLREPQVGAGFPWGRFSLPAIRSGALPLFAFKKPLGLLQRLIGRSPN